MPREIRCPHSDCGIVIKVSDDISEEKALCPGCQRDVSVQPQPSQKFNNLAIVEDIGVRQPAEVSSQAVPPKSNKKRAYIGIAIGIGALVVVLLGVLIAVAINKAIIAQKQSLCRSNLSQMSWALKQYNNEFQVFPASLSMASSYMWGGTVLQCPSADQALGAGGDYAYSVPPGAVMPDNSYGWIVAYDKSFNHENGRNVLYADSRVEWLSEEEFFKRLDAQEERLSEME